MPVSHYIASDGKVIPADSLAKTYGYYADGSMQYRQVTWEGVVYRQSYVWDGNGNLFSQSEWVRQ